MLVSRLFYDPKDSQSCNPDPHDTARHSIIDQGVYPALAPCFPGLRLQWYT